MYGQALLDIPCYKILMGCDGKNLQETKDLYNLTDAEQELLESKRRGHALFIIGSKRLHVNLRFRLTSFPIWARLAAGNSVAAGSNPGRLTYSTQEVFR